LIDKEEERKIEEEKEKEKEKEWRNKTSKWAFDKY
jgi:hypothetical protein